MAHKILVHTFLILSCPLGHALPHPTKKTQNYMTMDITAPSNSTSIPSLKPEDFNKRFRLSSLLHLPYMNKTLSLVIILAAFIAVVCSVVFLCICIRWRGRHRKRNLCSPRILRCPAEKPVTCNISQEKDSSRGLHGTSPCPVEFSPPSPSWRPQPAPPVQAHRRTDMNLGMHSFTSSRCPYSLDGQSHPSLAQPGVNLLLSYCDSSGVNCSTKADLNTQRLSLLQDSGGPGLGIRPISLISSIDMRPGEFATPSNPRMNTRGVSPQKLQVNRVSISSPPPNRREAAATRKARVKSPFPRPLCSHHKGVSVVGEDRLPLHVGACQCMEPNSFADGFIKVLPRENKRRNRKTAITTVPEGLKEALTSLRVDKGSEGNEINDMGKRRKSKRQALALENHKVIADLQFITSNNAFDPISTLPRNSPFFVPNQEQQKNGSIEKQQDIVLTRCGLVTTPYLTEDSPFVSGREMKLQEALE